MHPSPQTVLERGADAGELLASPVFLGVMNDLSSYHIAQMLAAPPGPPGADIREHNHRMTFALREIVDTLEGHKAAAEETLRHLKDDDEEDPDSNVTDLEDSL